MVKTIFITIDDDDHERLTAIKKRRGWTWEEMLKSAARMVAR